MTLLVDSREVLPLTSLFPRVQGVEVKNAGLPYGDYHALYWFTSRKELAWWIVERYLAHERVKA